METTQCRSRMEGNKRETFTACRCLGEGNKKKALANGTNVTIGRIGAAGESIITTIVRVSVVFHPVPVFSRCFASLCLFVNVVYFFFLLSPPLAPSLCFVEYYYLFTIQGWKEEIAMVMIGIIFHRVIRYGQN